MRISLNWLKKYVDIKVTDEELVRLIGARLVEIEGVIDESHKYDKIYAVKVVSAEKIPETHLSLCKIDAGDAEIPKVEKDENGLIQVICGAPNVHADMYAAWIAPGAVVPASVHEDAPFVIGKRRMLGKYDSNGMLAGADELDFCDDHSGIVELNPDDVTPGKALADIFELNDKILDIENKSLTHRPDCFGVIGFAREVAGILGQKFVEPEMLVPEDVANKKLAEAVSSSVSAIKIKILGNEICPCYSAAVLDFTRVPTEQKYLTWQDTILAKSGMRPISPIVDLTNYLMLLTGQPLHAFDYDKFVAMGGKSAPEVVVRLAENGEKLVLLDDKEIELNENDIVITSSGVPVALAGAMGGENTEIDENTQKIILESATFSLYNLRKTQMAHGIFSEAITRFTKGQPAAMALPVLAEATARLGNKLLGFACESKNEQSSCDEVKVTVEEINGLLGTDYSEALIKQTLENVGFEVKPGLSVKVPFWRTDIHIKEDITEEVGRLLGYDNIKPVLPAHFTAEKNAMFELKRNIRDVLAKFGANEVLTYSFVSEKLLEKAAQDKNNSYKIVNSISPVLQYVRQSIVPSLLDKTYMNEKLPVDKFAIFEMNMVYRKDLGLNSDGVPPEKMQLGMVVAERKNDGTAFYAAKKYVNELLQEFNVEIEYAPLKNDLPESKPFEKKRSAEIWINGVYAGVVGEFKNSVKYDFKLAPYLAGFEIDLSVLLEQKSHQKKLKIGKKVMQDLTVTTDKNYAETLTEVKKQYPDAEILPGVIYQADGQETKNMTFHIVE